MNETNNPLLDLSLRSPQLPFDQITAAHVAPAIDTLLTQSRAAVNAIAQSKATTYDGVLRALERATEPLSRAMGVVSHLESVVTTPELRAAVNEVKPRVSEFYASIPLDPELWKAVSAYAKTPDAAALTGARKRHLKNTLDEFRRAGADLPPAGKERLLAIDVELSKVTQKYSENVLDATNAWELVIEDESRLAGLPPSAIAGARAAAAAKGLKGWRFTLHAPSVIGVLTYLDDASIREKIWRAFNTRASTGEHDNGPLVLRILALRKEKATILGKRDFADLVLEDRMAKDGARASAFVLDLERRTQPAFAREKEQLLAFRRELEGASAPALSPWDVGYYTEKLRLARHDFDEEALRPYFSADHVLGGLFSLAGTLYGVTFAKVELPTWHDSVQVFSIRDGDQQLGIFHVDLFPRESKRGGAWMNSLVMGGPNEKGGFDPHVGLFCANATPPVDGQPALLTHDEVETLFHEFGHLLHQLLSNVDVRSLAGTNVAWDFVELPSQIMENWTWERASLDLFARHFETGAPIPGEIFEKMIASKNFRSAGATMRQVAFAKLDLLMHTRTAEFAAAADVEPLARAAIADCLVPTQPPGPTAVKRFTHIFADPVGYAAAYYSYKWAEVLDADAFTRFRREGIFNAAVGADFIEKILSRGNSAEPAELFRAFMGRDPDPNALLLRAGLAG